jgi:hypothetical protein
MRNNLSHTGITIKVFIETWKGFRDLILCYEKLKSDSWFTLSTYLDPAKTSKTHFPRWFHLQSSLRSSLVAMDNAWNIRFASDFLSNEMEASKEWGLIHRLKGIMQRVNFSRSKARENRDRFPVSLFGKFVHVGSNSSRCRFRAMSFRCFFARYVRGESTSVALT